MATAPRAVVEAPLAQPPRVGLIPSVAAVQGESAYTDDTARWAAGFSFAPENCGNIGAQNPCGGASKDIDDNQDVVNTEPIVLWAGDKCSPFDRSRDFGGRARRQLAAAESYQLASELWNGTLAKTELDAAGAPWPNQFLTSEASDVLTSGPTSPTDALAELEYALGQCAHGARGMIHVTLHTATYLFGLQLIRREGNLLLTVLDTIVVADAGYGGAGPYGAAEDGSQWAYATGMVQVRLGPVEVLGADMSQQMDRSVNTVEVIAERLGAASWDGCCHLAAELDLGWAAIGGAGS